MTSSSASALISLLSFCVLKPEEAQSQLFLCVIERSGNILFFCVCSFYLAFIFIDIFVDLVKKVA